MLGGKTGLMTALVEGRYRLMPIPDPKLGLRKLDVASTYNVERCRPRQQAKDCRCFSTAPAGRKPTGKLGQPGGAVLSNVCCSIVNIVRRFAFTETRVEIGLTWHRDSLIN